MHTYIVCVCVYIHIYIYIYSNVIQTMLSQPSLSQPSKLLICIIVGAARPELRSDVVAAGFVLVVAALLLRR